MAHPLRMKLDQLLSVHARMTATQLSGLVDESRRVAHGTCAPWPIEASSKRWPAARDGSLSVYQLAEISDGFAEVLARGQQPQPTRSGYTSTSARSRSVIRPHQMSRNQCTDRTRRRTRPEPSATGSPPSAAALAGVVVHKSRIRARRDEVAVHDTHPSAAVDMGDAPDRAVPRPAFVPGASPAGGIPPWFSREFGYGCGRTGTGGNTR